MIYFRGAQSIVPIIETYPFIMFYNSRNFAQYFTWKISDRRKSVYIDGALGSSSCGELDGAHNNQFGVCIRGGYKSNVKFSQAVIAAKSLNLLKERYTPSAYPGVACFFPFLVIKFLMYTLTKISSASDNSSLHQYNCWIVRTRL